ncbi:MAG TPA: integron integrase, partial [Gemmatimonadaceae bacterium]|nr:integron integrase [Gemmatimonadaceae bacterium]
MATDSSSSSSSHASRPRLLERLRDELRVRHYSARTVEAYVGWVRRFVVHHGRRHPRTMGNREVTEFLTHLAVTDRVSASTQNQALAALRFLYRDVLGDGGVDLLGDIVQAKRPQRLPVVLTRGEVRAVLAGMRGVPRLVASLLYGSGLRLMEGVTLRVHDLDFGRGELTVRSGKGNKDRVTPLPGALHEPLAEHLARARERHLSDLESGAGGVSLPEALARKYPNAGRSWGWQYVFAAARHYVDPSNGERRRHHVHETVVQRAVRESLLATGITKHATCHTFR